MVLILVLIVFLASEGKLTRISECKSMRCKVTENQKSSWTDTSYAGKCTRHI